jgi:hypothetical protein
MIRSPYIRLPCFVRRCAKRLQLFNIKGSWVNENGYNSFPRKRLPDPEQLMPVGPYHVDDDLFTHAGRRGCLSQEALTKG